MMRGEDGQAVSYASGEIEPEACAQKPGLFVGYSVLVTLEDVLLETLEEQDEWHSTHGEHWAHDKTVVATLERHDRDEPYEIWVKYNDICYQVKKYRLLFDNHVD